MSQLNINIKANNLTLTEELKEVINEKISHIGKFMNLHEDQMPIVDVEISKKYGEHHKQGEVFYAEINIKLDGKFYRSEEKTEDILKSIDEATSEMIRQIRKSKEKRRDFFKRGGEAIKNLLRFGR